VGTGATRAVHTRAEDDALRIEDVQRSLHAIQKDLIATAKPPPRVRLIRPAAGQARRLRGWLDAQWRPVRISAPGPQRPRLTDEGAGAATSGLPEAWGRLGRGIGPSDVSIVPASAAAPVFARS